MMKRIYIVALALAFITNMFAVEPAGDRTVEKHWTVNPHLYANNMTMVGVIMLNGTELQNENVEVGAFCGEECRGSEVLKHYAAVDRYLLYLTVYGEDDDVINFRLYDHVVGQELDLTCSNTVTFVTNEMLGTPSNPFVFDFTDETPMPPYNEVVITLRPGWNWISYLLTIPVPLEEALANLIPSDGDVIKGQNSFCTYNAALQLWQGSMDSMVPGQGYMYLNNGSETKAFTYPIP